jgi:AAA domain
MNTLTAEFLEPPEIETATPESASLAEILREREFKPHIEPPLLRPLYTLNGTCISTPGNLSTITSAIKTGKTAVIGAMAGATMPHSEDADLLGFNSSNPKGMALLWFDSEQSPDDFWHGVYRALKRVGLREPPPWLHAYCLTGLGCKRGWEAVLEATRMATEQHAGIHSLLLDGAADFVADVNDARESNAFVAEIQDMAIRHDCHIAAVIHFNPGSDKSRGHLGSQLERKAETNLRLDREDEFTVLWSNKQRRSSIPRDFGPRFTWSEEAGMHVTVESRAAARRSAKAEAAIPARDDAFHDHPAMRFNELVEAVKITAKVSERTAARRVQEWLKLGIIEKSVANLWIPKT